jgi:hypothetical protein
MNQHLKWNRLVSVDYHLFFVFIEKFFYSYSIISFSLFWPILISILRSFMITMYLQKIFPYAHKVFLSSYIVNVTFAECIMHKFR